MPNLLVITGRLRRRCPLSGQRDTGASLVEYALLVALIAVVCFVAVVFFGGETSASFSRTGLSIRNS